MLKRRRAIALIALMVVAVAFTGCAGIDTPQKKRLLADKTFTSNLERYNAFYKLQTPELQADLKAKVDPIWKAGDAALDAWEVAIDKGMPVQEKIEAFRLIKDQLFILLMKYGFKMEDK